MRFSIFQAENVTLEEQIAIELRTHTYAFTFVFDVPQSIWTFIVFSWNKLDKNLVIYRNGKLVEAFQYTVCMASHYNVSNSHITLGVPGVSYPNASYDDVAIWYKALSVEFIAQIYEFYKGEQNVFLKGRGRESRYEALSSLMCFHLASFR